MFFSLLYSQHRKKRKESENILKHEVNSMLFDIFKETIINSDWRYRYLKSVIQFNFLFNISLVFVLFLFLTLWRFVDSNPDILMNSPNKCIFRVLVIVVSRLRCKRLPSRFFGCSLLLMAYFWALRSRRTWTVLK